MWGWARIGRRVEFCKLFLKLVLSGFSENGIYYKYIFVLKPHDTFVS